MKRLRWTPTVGQFWALDKMYRRLAWRPVRPLTGLARPRCLTYVLGSVGLSSLTLPQQGFERRTFRAVSACPYTSAGVR